MYPNFENRKELVNWKPPWNEMEKREFIKQFLMGLFMFISSNLDVWSDGLLAYTYITGTTYDYHFEFLSDSQIEMLNCTVSPTFNETAYDNYCFEKDFSFGIGTLAIMLGPGLLLSFLLACDYKKNGILSCTFILLSPLICALYPITLFIVKVSTAKSVRKRYESTGPFFEFLIRSFGLCQGLSEYVV